MTTDGKTRGFWSGWTRGLAMAGLVVVGGLIQGCILETSSGPPATCFDSALTFRWTVSEGNVSIACPPDGIVTVVIDNSDATTVDFDCSVHAGTTPAMLQGGVTHDVSFFLHNANSTYSSIEHVQVPVGCGVTQRAPDVDFSLTPI